MVKFKMSRLMDKQTQVVSFSAISIALYGYDQGMMSLINTNYDYLKTMGLSEEDPMVGVIVSVYYLGCAVGAVLASRYSDAKGRKLGIILCLATASLGNAIMFIAGLGQARKAQAVMLLGRVIMGLGVGMALTLPSALLSRQNLSDILSNRSDYIGGIDAVVPVYSSELAEDDARGTALAQEFQANIFGLNMAFIINVLLTQHLGKYNQWAWRLPIIIMQIFPVLLFTVASLLPETPRWYIMHDDETRAKRSIAQVFGQDAVGPRIEELTSAHKKEQEEGGVLTYADLLWPTGSQFHPTVVTVMGQVNQALTGYGAVSVYGPQIFELLGFGVSTAEYLTLGNYLFYLAMMTFAWTLIDRKGRRWLMVRGAFWLSVSFAALTLFGGLAANKHTPLLATGIPGIITLYLATAVFGIGWLVPPWLIPTEIYPSTARAQGAAVSVVVWGLANFAVTLLTPIGFNNLKYYLFLVFCLTNAVAGVWTYLYVPESGNRTFEENQEFFVEAAEKESWNVRVVRRGEFRRLPDDQKDDEGGDESGIKKKDKGKGKGRDGQSDREPLLGGGSA